jgi:hypothetical protein
MTGHQFEFYYARLLECLGWTRIRVTGDKPGGDGGADILATDPRNRDFAIQRKRYAPANAVAIGDVRELNGALAHEHPNRLGMIVTTSRLTPPAGQLAARTGIRAVARPAPEARTTSLPSCAGCLVPSTGASTKASPLSLASRMHRSVPCSPIVLICSQMAPSLAPGRADSMALSTVSASGSMVRMTSAPSAASAGDPVTTAPSPASGSAAARVRFQARTPTPPRAMLRARPDPMLPPAPRTATTRSEDT